MRVLYLCHSYHDVSVGGVAEFLHYLTSSLKPFGVESVIYTRGDSQGQTILKNDVAHHYGAFLKPRFFLAKKELLPLLQLCREQQIDLVHAQGTYRAGYMAMHLQKQSGIPYIITSHSDIAPVNSARIKRANIQKRCRKILRNAAFVTHLTPVMADYSHAVCDTRNKSALVHNGIDMADWQPYLGLPEQNYLLAIGRLEPEKGFSVIIDAYAKLYAQGVKTSLIIAGKGSHEAHLHEQVKRYQLPMLTDFSDFAAIPERHVIFTGYVRAEQKKKLFASTKFVLFPTQPDNWEEAFGIVQLEAMAAAKAIVGSDIAATRYLQQLGMQVQLVTASDVHAWTSEIHALLQNPARYQAMGAENLRQVQQFDWSLIAKNYADVYMKVVGKKLNPL